RGLPSRNDLGGPDMSGPPGCALRRSLAVAGFPPESRASGPLRFIRPSNLPMTGRGPRHAATPASSEITVRVLPCPPPARPEPILVLSNVRLMHERIRLGAVSIIHADDLAAVIMAGTNWLLDEQLDRAAQILGGAS